jgi:hypothetical protein
MASFVTHPNICISPAEFWALSLREVAAIAAHLSGESPEPMLSPAEFLGTIGGGW